MGAVSALPLADHHNGKHHKEHEGVRALPEGPLRIERRANPPPPPYKPAPYAPPPPKYAPAPKPYGKPEKEFPPQPYQFEYGVADSYSGSKFQAAETQDDQGTVLGKNSYRLAYFTIYQLNVCNFTCSYTAKICFQDHTPSIFPMVVPKLLPTRLITMEDSSLMSNTKVVFKFGLFS